MININLNEPKTKNKFDLKNLTKKQKYILIIIICTLLVVLLSIFFFKNKNKKVVNNSDTPDQVKNNKNPTPKPTPKIFKSPINGITLDEKKFNEMKDTPPLAVMIQNNIVSRPEYGLNEADVVYETLAEGGITRFMGIYWSEGSDYIRSVRSARKYFVELLGDYKNIIYMHEGYASGDPSISAIDAIHNNGVKSMGFGSGALQRDHDCETQKAIEHCAYTSTKLLWDLSKEADWKGDTSKIESWKFKEKKDASQFAGAELTDFTVSFYPGVDASYSVNWKYDAKNGKYSRFNIDGTPYVSTDEKQIERDVVIFQKIVSYPTFDESAHQYQEIIGEGEGYVMQEGKVYNVKWKKPDFNTRTRFYDKATDKEFVFDSGKFWINLVSKELDFINNAPTPSAKQ